jgi:hypothetical protein
MTKLINGMLWLIAALLVWGAVLNPPAYHATSCDPRWESCQVPRWCPSTGSFLPPFSGYCPVGPHNYSPPFGDDDDA